MAQLERYYGLSDENITVLMPDLEPSMTIHPLLALAMAVSVVACQPRFTTSVDENGDPLSEEADTSSDDDYSDWEGAQLMVQSPVAGELLWLNEPADFQAEIMGTDGSILDWDELSWTTDLDADWSETGANFENDTLPAGLHNLKVETTLPTGDHLVWVVGGVQVLHEHAGTYVGNMIVDAISEFDGTEYTASCIGAAIVVVDQEGRAATGDSTCLLSILGYDLEANYDFSLDIDADELDGVAALDLTFTTTDFEASGEVEGGELTASWNDSLYDTLDISGSLELERISYDVP